VNAWEEALSARVHALRSAEERLLWRSLALQSTMEALIFFAPGVATFLVLVTRDALDRAEGGDGMEIEEAYAVLGLCNVLVKQFNVFPRATKSFDEALVSFRRVERFLLLPEATPPPTPPPTPPQSQHASLEASQRHGGAVMAAPPPVAAEAEGVISEDVIVISEDVIALEGASSSWEEMPAPVPEVAVAPEAGAEVRVEAGAEAGAGAAAVRSCALRELSLRVPRGTLSVIIGEVGCRPHVLEAATPRT
jgi:hypothetical protein